ncbi:putative Peptidase C13 family protein [Monocercomonoides exilis]|uniref:putative Peptidase C13 family protein n=1 Tax=Monocercomonoides exilis TaxID=2049356 RepID=UPI00355A414E|nr:putative Peptidase C13 family protein [Monocercomonoides exilis]|eukprot:MONOS_11363.1-p1 / transcript=MONOS_11363.1 / gene=MONOS_11363 / organism=Monocercomonoides_exilis_PA203 / gene_product=Peptidase C13 family protein / transcript_product=Peptidase C13 family protein / location=Mono_scaffold00566:16633-21320(+) / protein_length=1115 / sequence_SO=supercontig / SO=protein_coding / is_pseudo=false
MAYDDVLSWSKNPVPGKVYNHPEGDDVYPGSENIHYKGERVKAETFLAVLTGNTTAAKGPVLNTTEEDNIFIFFSDHGSVGTLSFPAGSYLHAKDFIETIKSMHEHRKYNKMLIYIEACYSGSMFNKLLPEDINVLAMTAANEKENSWSTYCDDDPKEELCLGDEMACAWMEHTEKVDLNSTDIQAQFEEVLRIVEESHPQTYGQKSMLQDMLGFYQIGNNTKHGMESDPEARNDTIFTRERTKRQTMPKPPYPCTNRLRMSDRNEGSWKTLPKEFFPLKIINTLPRGSEKNFALTNKLDKLIEKPMIIRSFGQLNLSHFETTPQGIHLLHKLLRASVDHPSHETIAAFSEEISKVKLADSRSDAMADFFASRKHILKQNNRLNSNGKVNQITDIKKYLINTAEVTEDLDLFKKMIEIYTHHCGVADEYSQIPHFKIMANSINLGLISQDDLVQMEFKEDKSYRRKPLENEKFLRGSSVTVGDSTHYDHQPIGEYKDKYRQHPIERSLTQDERTEIGNTLRKSSFELGDGVGDFVSYNQQAFTKHPLDEKHTPSINTTELQRSHISLGDQSPESFQQTLKEGFQTTTRAEFGKKDIPRDQSQTRDMVSQLRREHWSVGDQSGPVPPSHYATTARGDFVAHPEAGPAQLDAHTRDDIRRSHITLTGAPPNSLAPLGGGGGVVSRSFGPTARLGGTGQLKPGDNSSQFATTQRSDFVKYDPTSIRGIPEAGAATGILPGAGDPETKTALRKHHYSLGDGTGHFSTTTSDAFVKKELDPDVWDAIRDENGEMMYRKKPLENERFLRGSSVTVGDRTHNEEQPVPEYKAQFTKHPIDRSLTRDDRTEIGNVLRRSNFELGDGVGDFASTQQRSYVPHTLTEKHTPNVDTIQLQKSHLSLGDASPEGYQQAVRDGFQSTQRTDFAKKPLPRGDTQTREMVTQLRREHWSVGDQTGPVPPSHFASTTRGDFVAHPDAGPSLLDQDTRDDLRRSHVALSGSTANSAPPVGGGGGVVSRSFGPTAHMGAVPSALLPPGESSAFATTQRASFVKHDPRAVDAVPQAGTSTGILSSSSADPETKTALRKHHYDLGDGGRQFQTTYGETFVRQPLDPNVWEEVEDQ